MHGTYGSLMNEFVRISSNIASNAKRIPGGLEATRNPLRKALGGGYLAFSIITEPAVGSSTFLAMNSL